MKTTPIDWYQILELVGMLVGGLVGGATIFWRMAKVAAKNESDHEAINKHLESTDIDLQEFKKDMKERLDEISKQLTELLAQNARVNYLEKRMDTVEKNREVDSRILNKINDTVNNIRVDLEKKVNR